jgi:hypothetical protein
LKSFIQIPTTPCGCVTWSYIVLRNTESEPTGGLTTKYLIP